MWGGVGVGGGGRGRGGYTFGKFGEDNFGMKCLGSFKLLYTSYSLRGIMEFNPEEAEFEEAAATMKDNLARVSDKESIEHIKTSDFVPLSPSSLIEMRSYPTLGEQGNGVMVYEYRPVSGVDEVIKVTVDLVDEFIGDRTGRVIWPCR